MITSINKRLMLLKKYLLKTLPNIVAVIAYISLVSLMMFNGDRFFSDQEDSFIGPLAFLLLFVTSAAIMGILVFGQSVALYIDGKKKDAIYTLMAIISWLVIATFLIMIGIVLT